MEDLKIKEVAIMLRVSEGAVKAWYRDGMFPNAYKIVGNVRIPLSDVEALKQRPKEAS